MRSLPLMPASPWPRWSWSLTDQSSSVRSTRKHRRFYWLVDWWKAFWIGGPLDRPINHSPLVFCSWFLSPTAGQTAESLDMEMEDDNTVDARVRRWQLPPGSPYFVHLYFIFTLIIIIIMAMVAPAYYTFALERQKAKAFKGLKKKKKNKTKTKALK
jgi:hypothetical protein